MNSRLLKKRLYPSSAGDFNSSPKLGPFRQASTIWVISSPLTPTSAVTGREMAGEPVAGLVFHVTISSAHSPIIRETIMLPSPDPPSHNIMFNHACSMIALLGSAARSNCIRARCCSAREINCTYSVSSEPRLVSGKELLTVASATAVNVTAVGVVAASAGIISVSIMAITIARADISCLSRGQLIISAIDYRTY